jgi:hypothetical protein
MVPLCGENVCGHIKQEFMLDQDRKWTDGDWSKGCNQSENLVTWARHPLDFAFILKQSIL